MNPYLRRRVMDILHSDRLEADVKDLSLNLLMTAFAQMVASNGDHPPASMETSNLARHYASKLISDKFVVIRDPEDNRIYYTAAHGNDVVAVFYPMDIFYDIYCAIGSSSTVLASMGITTRTFTDHAIIDRIFRLPPERDNNVVIDTPVGVIDQQRHIHWQWHVPGSEIPKEVAKAVQEHREGGQPELEVILPTVAAPGNNDRIVELAQAGAGTAMGQAFIAANQARGKDRRNDGDRRELAAASTGKGTPQQRHYESPGEQTAHQVAQQAENK